MTTHKEKQEDVPTSKVKQYMQSPGNVSCSICLDTVESAGDRSTARLKCGHYFHLDCIGSAFNAKGAMQCPNCRQVEGGQWLFASGCYLQQHLLRNTNADEDSSNYAGMHLNRYNEWGNDTTRRHPRGVNRQIPVENDYPSSTTTRWRAMASRDVQPWNVPSDEIERPPTPELLPPHVSGTYMQSSQPMVMHRPPLPHHGNIISNSSPMFEGPMLRPRIENDDPLFPYEMRAGFTSGHRYARNRGVNERGFAFNLLSPELRVQGAHGNLEQPPLMSSRFQDARFSQAGGDTSDTRRVGAYASRNLFEHERGSGSVHYQDPNQRSFANGYINPAHHLHSLNRAMSSHSYDGHQLGARVPWI